MNTDDDESDHDYLKRLPAEHYRGQAYVHWSMCIDQRKKGWLVSIFYYNFREILTHTMFRYGLTCPIYCCMPDHIHLLWIGILDGSDQRAAAKFFRKQLNPILGKLDARFQKQPYDHVLSDEERLQDAFETVVDYIACNPERAELVKSGCHRDYPYSDCLVPGYPELHLWQYDYWERFWRTYAYLREHGLVRVKDDD
jgi:putative transposase